MEVIVDQHLDQEQNFLPTTFIESPTFSVEATINNASADIDSTSSYEERRKALQKIHSVENEANKIRKMREQGLSEREMQLYTHDQVVNQVTEHSIGVPYNTLTIIAKPDGRFTMYGMDILEMYRETAEMTSEGSQQWSEYQTYKSLYDSLNAGANVAIEVSPAYEPSTKNPSPAERSFAFLHRVGKYDPDLEGTVIREDLLRWNGRDLERDKKIFQGIQYRAGLQPTPIDEIKSRSDITESPIAFASEDPDNIDPFLEAVGISQADIDFSHQAKTMLEEAGTPLLLNYHQLIQTLSTIEDKNSIHYALTKRRAEAIIEKVFILGSKIRNWLKGESAEHPFYHLDLIQRNSSETDSQYFERIYTSNLQNNGDLQIKGGSDCGTVSRTVFDEILNKNPLEASLHGGKHGKHHESNTNCATCPLCGKVETVQVVKGRYYCTGCEEYGPEAK